MLLANLDGVDERHLQSLCDEKCPESQYLDFKLALPGTAPEEKQELMKDVCAFANADGGDLVYGVAEASGAAAKVMPMIGEPADAAKRRVAQVLDAIEPRIQGVQIQPVNVAGGYALVLRVPGSFDGPHSYRVGTLRRFVIRNGTSTTDMSMDQIRNAFDRTATLSERAREFIAQRMQAVELHKTWKPFVPGPICAVVLAPLAGLAGRLSVDIGALNNSYNRFMFKEWGSVSRTMNLDGLAVYPNGTKEGSVALSQVFRNGAVECLRTGANLSAFPGQKINHPVEHRHGVLPGCDPQGGVERTRPRLRGPCGHRGRSDAHRRLSAWRRELALRQQPRVGRSNQPRTAQHLDRRLGVAEHAGAT